MKHSKHFALLLATVALSFLAVSCSKDFQDDIDDLNSKYTQLDQRVKDLETQVSKINSDLSTLSVLATAVENGFYITSVKTTANGYELTLSNGHVIVLMNGPSNTLMPAPAISMTLINGIYYWTLNGMLITGDDGRLLPANGQTPVVKYDSVTLQWLISLDGGVTFQSVNVYASIVINDEVLLQVLNTYVSQHSTTLISQDILFQIISTYIQSDNHIIIT